MAYNNPEATPINDWDAPVITGTAIAEAKAAHASPPLNTNQLTHDMYGASCRRFAKPYGGNSSIRYMLKNNAINSGFINDSSDQDISGVFRKFPVDNGTCTPSLILRQSSTNFYCANLTFAGVKRLYLLGNHGETNLITVGPALIKLIPTLIDENDWFGMRLTAANEGSDVRLRLYLALGSSVLNVLDGDGEPAWVEYMSCLHQNGTVTPQEPVGHTSIQGFGNTTPNLSGTPGFAHGGAYNGTDHWYYDAIRIKRLVS